MKWGKAQKNLEHCLALRKNSTHAQHGKLKLDYSAKSSSQSFEPVLTSLKFHLFWKRKRHSLSFFITLGEMLTKSPVLFMIVPNLSRCWMAYFYVPGFQFIYWKVKHQSSLSKPIPLTRSHHLRKDGTLLIFVFLGPDLKWTIVFKKSHQVLLYKYDSLI